jgi:hypothetical protein
MWILEMIDAEDHLLYASDYPHWDFDLPSVIYDLPFLKEETKRKILGGTPSSSWASTSPFWDAEGALQRRVVVNGARSSDQRSSLAPAIGAEHSHVLRKFD